MRGRLNPRQVTTLVTVRTWTGNTGWGDGYADPPAGIGPIYCQLEGGAKIVSTGAGEQVVAEQTLRIPRSRRFDVEKLFVPESLVTVRGRESRVLTASPVLSRGGLVYLELTTT